MLETNSTQRELKAGALAYFYEAMARYSPANIAERLGLHGNTVTRWIEQNKVPNHYAADLLRLLGKKGIAHQQTVKDKDQYYTKPQTAKDCYAMFCATTRRLGLDLSKYHFIEPAAGGGGFYDLLPPRRRQGIDIDPTAKRIVKADYLQWTPNQRRKYAVIGNPPFGLRGHLALLFINHSHLFADVVGFILPQLFESDGKGAPSKRVVGYQLASSQKLSPNSFAYPDGREVCIHTVFQVWSKVNTHKIKPQKKVTCDQFIRVYSLSDGGTPSSTRNKKMIGNCDVYIPSTCFSGMKAYETFEELPHRRGYGVVIRTRKRDIKRLFLSHDWSKTAFYSTNSAVNMRKSLIEKVAIDGGYIDR